MRQRDCVTSSEIRKSSIVIRTRGPGAPAAIRIAAEICYGHELGFEDGLQMMSTPDKRPPTAIGHVILRVSDIAKSAQFFERLGLRPIMQNETIAILELRGGTHLLLFPAKRAISGKRIRNFDLMVDDVRMWRKKLKEEKLNVTELRNDHMGGHLWFEVIDPDGRSLGLYSSHTDGRQV